MWPKPACCGVAFSEDTEPPENSSFAALRVPAPRMGGQVELPDTATHLRLQISVTQILPDSTDPASGFNPLPPVTEQVQRLETWSNPPLRAPACSCSHLRFQSHPEPKSFKGHLKSMGCKGLDCKIAVRIRQLSGDHVLPQRWSCRTEHLEIKKEEEPLSVHSFAFRWIFKLVLLTMDF